MKNFPHQYNQLTRFRGTLEVIRDLSALRQNVLDDEVLGYALARAHVYNFRGDVPDLEARILQERRKKSDSQGAQTAARDGRRTLQLLDFIDSAGALTASGRLVLQQQAGSSGEIALWREAVIAMRVADEDGNESHPMRILLRLLLERGPLRRTELALALEPKDDTEQEYERAAAFIGMPDIERKKRLGVSDSRWNNAVKILPALALQLGLATERGDDQIAVSDIGAALCASGFQFGDILADATEQPAPPNERPVRRERGRMRRRVGPRRPAPFDPESFNALTPEEQVQAARLRSERTARHEQVVVEIAAAFEGRFDVYEDPMSYDALLVPNDAMTNIFLLEVKTLDLDETDQTNRAVAQLFWYKWSNVTPAHEGRAVLLGVVYDRVPSDETCRYLSSLGIGAFCCCDGFVRACNPNAQVLCPQPVPIPTDLSGSA